MASPKFQALRGTRDILTPDSERHRALVDVFAEQCRLAGYGHIMSPIFEDLGVFLRVGESTDVVTKEMYDFEDKDGRRIALRPELTASVVRAFVQHNPTNLPWKAWYEGPQFRHEKPQAGRYRQFSQVGIEVLGSNDPQVDVEVIALAWRFYQELGMQEVSLLLNSLGDDACRPAYFEALETYFRDRSGELSEASQETLDKNPLRVLDSKRSEDESIIAEAPLMVDHLTAETAEHLPPLDMTSPTCMTSLNSFKFSVCYMALPDLLPSLIHLKSRINSYTVFGGKDTTSYSRSVCAGLIE